MHLNAYVINDLFLYFLGFLWNDYYSSPPLSLSTSTSNFLKQHINFFVQLCDAGAVEDEIDQRCHEVAWARSDSWQTSRRRRTWMNQSDIGMRKITRLYMYEKVIIEEGIKIFDRYYFYQHDVSSFKKFMS